jgi:hypothetical protein
MDFDGFCYGSLIWKSDGRDPTREELLGSGGNGYGRGSIALSGEERGSDTHLPFLSLAFAK